MSNKNFVENQAGIKIKPLGMLKGKRGDLLFYTLMMALPVLQFVMFYIVVNANTVILTFKSYERANDVYRWVGLDNLKLALHDLRTLPLMRAAAKNSLIVYAYNLLLAIPLCLFFSYYIFKKMHFYRFFKVMLFMPSIVSMIVMAMIFNYFVERALPDIIFKLFDYKIQGLLSSKSTGFGMIIFYNIWISFGVSLLMYSNSMSGISESVLESARLDGITALKEFFYIVLPLIYPTLSTYLVVGIAGLFMNQANIFSFFGVFAPDRYYTLGYYLFVKTESATLANYPYLASMGLLFTVVAFPLTMIVKKLLERLGPSDE